MLTFSLYSISNAYSSIPGTESSSACITYDPNDNIITITCKSATLTDIDNQLKDPDILQIENIASKVWLLNAGIVIENQAHSILIRLIHHG